MYQDTILAGLVGAAILALLWAAFRYFKGKTRVAAVVAQAEEDLLTFDAKAIEAGLKTMQRAYADKLKKAANLQAETDAAILALKTDAADIAAIHQRTRDAIAALPPLAP